MSLPIVQPSAAERERIARASRVAAWGAEGIAALVEQLDDPSWVVRRAVIQLLAKAGEPAAVALLHTLRTARDLEARIAAAVDALVTNPAPIDALILELHDDPNSAVVADMAEIVGRRGSRAAIPVLRELVEGEDDVVAVAAIEALGRIGSRSAVDSLVGAVRSGRFFRTFPAIDVLGRSGDPRALAPLTELLDDPRYTHEAARALGRTGDPGAVGPLLELLKRPGDAQVRVAAQALAELREMYATLYGNADAIDLLVRDRAVPTASRRLVTAVRSSSVTEQAAIVRLLGAMASEDAFGVLVELLDGPELVARPAAEALKKLGTAGMHTLSSTLRNGDSARRRLVLAVLQPRSVALDDVIVTLADPDGVVRATACELLGRMGQPAAVPALFELLCDPNARVSHAALGAIQGLGGELAESLGITAAASASPQLRRQAFRLIGYFGFTAGVDALLRGLEDPDPPLRELAVQSLGYVDDPRAREAVMLTSRHAEPRMRAAAMRALAQGERPVGGPRLLEALEDEDAWVRYYACQSLGRLQHEEAAPALARRLADPAGQVRVGAIEAMSQLRSPAALAYLVQGARSSDDDVRRACITGMAIGRRMEALPLVLDATTASDAATRLVATSAIAAFDAAEVPARLVELAVVDPDEAVRFAALAALGERPGRAATVALVGLLGRPDASGSQARVRELLSTSIPGRIDGIVDALREADDEIAAVLTSALARMRSVEGHAALVVGLALPNPAARRAAAITAAAIGSRPLLDALRARVQTDPDPDVRHIIGSALRS
jgi:HEAT repeat protein